MHVKSLDAHRARSLLGARLQLVGMATRISNHVRGILKVFGAFPGKVRDLRFDRRVEVCLAERPDLAPIVSPMLASWRQLRLQVGTFDKLVRALVMQSPDCRRLMSVPGIGPLTVLAYPAVRLNDRAGDCQAEADAAGPIEMSLPKIMSN